MALQQIKNRQFIFANYWVLRYVISAKCCKNLPFTLSKPVNTLEFALFSEQLWSNVLFHQASLLAEKLEMSEWPAFGKYTLTYFLKLRGFSCASPQRKQEQNQELHGVPVAACCNSCVCALQQKVVLFKEEGFEHSFHKRCNDRRKHTEQNTAPKFERYKIQY